MVWWGKDEPIYPFVWFTLIWQPAKSRTGMPLFPTLAALLSQSALSGLLHHCYKEVKGQLQSCGISTWYLGYKSTQVNFCPTSVSSSCQVYWAVFCMYDAFHLHNSNKEFWASVLLMLDSTRWREPFGGESLSIGSTLDLRIETWSEILLNMVIRLSKAKQSAFLLSQIVCRWLNNWPQSGHSHALTIPAWTLKLWTGTTAITVAVGNTSFFSFARENSFTPCRHDRQRPCLQVWWFLSFYGRWWGIVVH